MQLPVSKFSRSGSALLLTMVMVGVGLLILAAAMSWSSSSTRLTHRSIQYLRSVEAAEAATEKVIANIQRDFLYGGESLVQQNLKNYRKKTVPSAADSANWLTWVFDDGQGNAGQTYVRKFGTSGYVALTAPYVGLNAFVTTYVVASHASDTASIQSVKAGVYQQLQLASIPIFQFAMYSSGDMEISCGQPFNITGPVHSNGNLYVEPDSFLTFLSGVTAVGTVEFGRNPLDTRGSPVGGVVYVQTNMPVFPVATLTLPIGVSNSPSAVREIIEPPPPGENPASPLGRLRYYNQADLVVVVSDTGAKATSGSFNDFATVIPTNDVSSFVSTTSSFYDPREGKTVVPIDLNIGKLTAWNATNNSLRTAQIGQNLTSVYVVDNRSLPATQLGAVRVVNGKQLPPDGLTVATGRPLYVQGDYNQTNAANLGTADTSTTVPASLVGDAITILSDAWTDANSSSPVGSRVAASTTVNAAILTGDVPTTAGVYSGGMENFPRFLETWGAANVFTYNGSMIKMFPSLYAIGVWGQNNVYSPPARHWAFDPNFTDPTKLPPRTPSLLRVIRSQWANANPGENVPR